MKKIDEKSFIKTCEESLSMYEACSKLGMHFNTFKRWAMILGCYKTNQSGRGVKKTTPVKVSLEDILTNKKPFQSFKLKNRLLKEGILKNKCDLCSIENWNGKPISIELDHVNGNRNGNRLENLRMLCPNCHSQTDTYRSKNIKN